MCGTSTREGGGSGADLALDVGIAFGTKNLENGLRRLDLFGRVPGGKPAHTNWQPHSPVAIEGPRRCSCLPQSRAVLRTGCLWRVPCCGGPRPRATDPPPVMHGNPMLWVVGGGPTPPSTRHPFRIFRGHGWRTPF